MKRFFYWLSDMTVDIISLMKQNPVSAFSLLIIPYGVLFLLVKEYYSPMPIPPLVRGIVLYTFFLLIGIIGILTIKTKNAPLFAIPIRGKPAVIIGLYLVIVSFGLIIYGLIFDLIRFLNSR